MKVKWIGFGALCTIVILSVLYVIVRMEKDNFFGVLIFLSILLLVGLFFEWKEERRKENLNDKGNNLLIEGLFVIGGGIATYFMSYFLGNYVVLFSTMVGLVGHFAFRKWEVAIFCGSFAGMTSIFIINPYQIVLAAVLTALIYALTKPIFKGFGGKLGTIAFTGTILSFLLLEKSFAMTSVIEPNAMIVYVAVLGVVSTYIVQHILKQTPVFASSVTTLVFSILVVTFFNQNTMYLAVFYAASFVGMSDKKRLPNIAIAGLAGVTIGYVYTIFTPYYNGAGGKLGTMALISTIMISGLNIFMRYFIKLLEIKPRSDNFKT